MVLALELELLEWLGWLEQAERLGQARLERLELLLALEQCRPLGRLVQQEQPELSLEPLARYPLERLVCRRALHG